MQDVVIVSACRTPIGTFMGSLKDVVARDLAMIVAREAIVRAGIDAEIVDEICMGQVYGAGQGSLPARQVGMRVGMSGRSAACNVNQNCASGMRALEIACHDIMLDKTDVALVVGVESMTNAPYLLPKARMGYRMGDGTIEDHMIHDGLFDELVPGHMGLTAENVAERYAIGREECDELAMISHKRAVTAIDNGYFAEEIVPVEIKGRKGSTIFAVDEHPRRDITTEALGKLKPAFKEGGVVTAGNSSGINDAAAAVVVMSGSKARELDISPLVKLVGICSEGVAPEVMGLGPAVAIPKLLSQAGVGFSDIEYWEINEAFAAQFLGVARMLERDRGIVLDMDRVNRNGSGIALGHPVGCTALRIIVSLVHEMKRHDLAVGGASLCVGGGPGMASLWTRDI